MTLKVEITLLKYYLVLAVMILSVFSSIASVGYFVRKVDDIDRRLVLLEREGSITSRLTAKDVQWIMKTIIEQNDTLHRLERKIDNHMLK